MIQIQQFRFNPLGVNTWILFDEEGIGIVVDPAMHTSTEFEQFHKFIRDRNIQLKMVINTHGHFDHVPGVAGVVDEYHCHYLVHTAEPTSPVVILIS
ncbi:MAG: MBL fold metallo-hydrolase [Bacteroidales bacterium]|nr:MBL fold metallo-hydrolase [Bacteroidales bacterium]